MYEKYNEIADRKVAHLSSEQYGNGCKIIYGLLSETVLPSKYIFESDFENLYRQIMRDPVLSTIYSFHCEFAYSSLVSTALQHESKESFSYWLVLSKMQQLRAH